MVEGESGVDEPVVQPVDALVTARMGVPKLLHARFVHASPPRCTTAASGALPVARAVTTAQVYDVEWC